MLDAFLSLDRSVDASCSCGCRNISHSLLSMGKNPSYIPAAAAGSVAKALGPLFSVIPGLKDLLGASGLLLLRVSDPRLEGDRDRRSSREDRFGSGSIWSKRDRFAVLRPSSAIMNEYRDPLAQMCLVHVMSRCQEDRNLVSDLKDPL